MPSVMRADRGADMEFGRVDSSRGVSTQIDFVQSGDPNTLQFNVHQIGTNSNKQEPSYVDVNRDQHSTDLIVLDSIVLASEAQNGWMSSLVDLYQCANSRSPFNAVLLVPSTSHRFVSQTSGVIRLAKILVPCISDPHPINALKYVARLVECLDQRLGSFTLLFVGSPDATPNINPPRVDGWSWVIKSLPGHPAEKILQQVECMEADLIVLPIVRMDISDSPTGSSCLGPIPLEVIRRSRCPTLLVPTDYG